MTKSQLHKEFDEKFCTKEAGDTFRTIYDASNIEGITEFYDSKIQEILEELVGEEIKRIDVKDYQEKYREPGIWSCLSLKGKAAIADATTLASDKGFNRKRSELLDNIKELGYE